MGTYQNSEYYDKAYMKGSYDVAPEQLHHYHMNWDAAIQWMETLLSQGWNGYKPNIVPGFPDIKNIVDLGCGPGHFGEMLKFNGISYHGYDFSKVAIEKAKKRVEGQINKNFYVMDLEKDFPKHEKVIYTAFEFFEHIPFDVDIINKLNRGDLIIFSIPSFDTESHVQYFPGYDDIHKKYDKHLNNVQIIFSAGGITPEGIDHQIRVVVGRKK